MLRMYELLRAKLLAALEQSRRPFNQLAAFLTASARLCGQGAERDCGHLHREASGQGEH